MANLLPAETVAAIRQLAKNGWSNRRVARELKVSRGTVARQLATPDGPDKADTKVSRPGPKSLCSRYEDHVLRLIEAGFSARAIHAELRRALQLRWELSECAKICQATQSERQSCAFS